MSGVVKMYMRTSIYKYRISTPALATALLICSGVWFASACEFFSASTFRGDWLPTPLFWMLMLMLTPAVCFSIGIIITDTRKRSPFSPLVWCAFLAASLPVSLGTLLAVWAVKMVFSMSGISF